MEELVLGSPESNADMAKDVPTDRPCRGGSHKSGSTERILSKVHVEASIELIQGGDDGHEDIFVELREACHWTVEILFGNVVRRDYLKEKCLYGYEWKHL